LDLLGTTPSWDCRPMQRHVPSICYVPENTSKHIGIGGDPAKHASWRLRGSISADCQCAAVNLPDVRNEPASGQNLLFRPFLASAVHTAVP
jgi:hypothetical protein